MQTITNQKLKWSWPGNILAKEILLKYFNNQILPHSLIFAGSSQIGKLDTAIDFAHLVLCENGEIDCKKCSKCKYRNISGGNIEIVDNDGLIVIDEVREWRKNFSRSDYDGNYRFLIINRPESMNKESANAFLKLLEEPGKNIVFILVTSKLYRIIDTIKSRSVILNFNRLAISDIDKSKLGGNEFTNIELLNLAMGKVKLIEKIKSVSKRKYLENVVNFWKLVFAPVYVKKEQIDKILKANGQLLKLLNFWEGCVRDLLLFRFGKKEKCWWQDDKLFELYSKINISTEKLIEFMDEAANLRINLNKGYAKKTWLLNLLIRLYL